MPFDLRPCLRYVRHLTLLVDSSSLRLSLPGEIPRGPEQGTNHRYVQRRAVSYAQGQQQRCSDPGVGAPGAHAQRVSRLTPVTATVRRLPCRGDNVKSATCIMVPVHAAGTQVRLGGGQAAAAGGDRLHLLQRHERDGRRGVCIRRLQVRPGAPADDIRQRPVCGRAGALIVPAT